MTSEKKKKKKSHGYCRMSRKRKNLVLITCLLHFERHGNPNICNNAACMFLFLVGVDVSVCFYIYIFFKKSLLLRLPTGLCRSSAGSRHEKPAERARVHVRFFQACVRARFSRGLRHRVRAVLLTERKRKKPPIVQPGTQNNYLYNSATQHRLVSGNKWNMHRLS